MLSAMLSYASLMNSVELARDEAPPFLITVDEDKIPAHIDVEDFGEMLTKLCSRIMFASKTSELSIEDVALQLFYNLETTAMFAGMPFAAFLEKVGGWVTIKQYKNGRLLAKFVTMDEMKTIMDEYWPDEYTIIYNEDEYLAYVSDEEIEKRVFVYDKHESDIKWVRGKSNKKENK